MRKTVFGATAFLLATAWPASVGFAQSNATQSISAEDKATGAKAHPELVAEFGGLMPDRRPIMSAASAKKYRSSRAFRTRSPTSQSRCSTRR